MKFSAVSVLALAASASAFAPAPQGNVSLLNRYQEKNYRIREKDRRTEYD
jgi:hypothetical protein